MVSFYSSVGYTIWLILIWCIIWLLNPIHSIAQVDRISQNGFSNGQNELLTKIVNPEINFLQKDESIYELLHTIDTTTIVKIIGKNETLLEKLNIIEFLDRLKFMEFGLTGDFDILRSSQYEINLKYIDKKETSDNRNHWAFGQYKFVVKTPSARLLVNMKLKGGLKSSSFLRGVGGVDFGEVAVPSTKLLNKVIRINYNPNVEDGYRMSIRIDENYYYPYLPDWQLLPIAKFANSKYDACVSLFGENTDEFSYDIIYHPAFENTLLGLRLLHADVMLTDLEEFKELPKINGNQILGKGETGNVSTNWNSTATSVQAIINKYAPQSWVFTDDDVTVNFFVSDQNQLKLTGNPYYFLWKDKIYIDMEKYENIDPDSLSDEEKDKILMEIFLDRNDRNEIASIDEAIEFIKKIDLKSLNEDVYTAAENTMKYGAFFRYIKITNPENWHIFLNTIGMVDIKPAINTPTTWEKN